jgi:ribonuclease-3 family protein
MRSKKRTENDMEELEKIDPDKINTTSLAFVGDAVYEIYIRKHVLLSGQTHADKLHRMSVAYVRAEAQAAVIKEIKDDLDPKLAALVRRARNHKSATRPKNADPVVYKWATAFEALIGHLYLKEETELMEEIIYRAIEIIEREKIPKRK